MRIQECRRILLETIASCGESSGMSGNSQQDILHILQEAFVSLTIHFISSRRLRGHLLQESKTGKCPRETVRRRKRRVES